MGTPKRGLPLLEGSRPYQLVGEVWLTKAVTRTGPERVFPHTGTETLPRLLRGAAVENLPQWAQA